MPGLLFPVRILVVEVLMRKSRFSIWWQLLEFVSLESLVLCLANAPAHLPLLEFHLELLQALVSNFARILLIDSTRLHSSFDFPKHLQSNNDNSFLSMLIASL